jgi:hypothetical protein
MIASPELETLAAELERQQASKRDLMADTRRMQLTVEHWDDPENAPGPGSRYVDLLVDNGEVEQFHVKRYAHQQLSDFTHVPWKVYERLHDNHPDLLAHLANGLMHREPGKRMIRVLDNQVRAVVSNRYRRLDNYDLMEQAVLPVMSEFPEMQITRWDLTDTRLYLKLTLPRELEIKVGDVARAGVIVSNSEVGAGSMLVAPFTEILWCSNGAVHMEYGKRRHHTGRRIDVEDETAYDLYSDETMRIDDQAYFAKVADLMRGACNETVFEQIVRQMQELAGIKVDADPVGVVEELSQRHGLTENEGSLLRKYQAQLGDTTAWGYHQALTRTAQDVEPDRQVELETIAGSKLLMMTRDEWVALAA